MLIVIAKARALPGKREELLAAITDVVRSSRADDGCHSYDFYSDVHDWDVVVSVEIWRDQDALDTHMSRRHTQDFLARFPSLVDGPPLLEIYPVRSHLDPT